MVVSDDGMSQDVVRRTKRSPLWAGDATATGPMASFRCPEAKTALGPVPPGGDRRGAKTAIEPSWKRQSAYGIFDVDHRPDTADPKINRWSQSENVRRL